MIELKPCVCGIDEQETIIQISRDEKEIHLWTSDNTRVTKMHKLINAPGSLWRLEKTEYTQEGDPFGYSFICLDKNMLTLRVKKVEQSEEQRVVLKDRIESVRAAKKR
jgi:hypothetical protein